MLFIKWQLVQLSLPLARDYKPGRRAMDFAEAAANLPRQAHRGLDGYGFRYWGKESYGSTTRSQSLDFWRVGAMLPLLCIFADTSLCTILSLKRQEDGSFRDEDLANLLKNA